MTHPNTEDSIIKCLFIPEYEHIKTSSYFCEHIVSEIKERSD